MAAVGDAHTGGEGASEGPAESRVHAGGGHGGPLGAPDDVGLGPGVPSRPSHSHAVGFVERSHRHRVRLAFIAVAMGLVAGLEVAGGLWTGSLALLADAAHASTDVFSVLLALYATHVALRVSASPGKTFGYYRAEIIAAFANAVLLGLLAAFLVFEAVERFRAPRAFDGLTVAGFALAIAAAEAVGLVMLHGAKGESLNVRSAFFHLLGDLTSTIGVAIAGLAGHWFAWYWLDPVVTVAIALLILYWAFRLITESSHILMEGTPKEIEPRAVRDGLAGLDGVAEVHDLHVWTLTSGLHSMSAHVVADHCDPTADLALRVRRFVHEKYGLEHVTIQVEDPCHHCGEAHD